MCIISDNIKFCTCVNDNIDIEELNHYWVLNRYNKNKDILALGLVIPSHEKFRFNYQENYLKIYNALKLKDIFDKQIVFEENDRLQVVLNNTSENREEVISFEFEYSSGEWVSLSNDNDPFYLMNHFDVINSGEIKEIE